MTTRRPPSKLRELDLSRAQLEEVRRAFFACVREGLASRGGQLKAFPTYIPAPTQAIAGEAAVIDIGGTNVRAAALSLAPGSRAVFTAEPAVSPLKPRWKSAASFFEFQAELLRGLGRGPGLPLGYCFSYPALVTPDRDAVLTAWTKDLQVPGVIGRRVGTLLGSALSSLGAPPFRVTVLNDTVAALVGGSWACGSGGEFTEFIGLIVGTGTNIAAFFPSRDVAAKADLSSYPHGRMAVNLESGNFHPPHLSRWDDELDRLREDAGQQRVEKAVSGKYLPEIFRFILTGEASPPYPEMREIARLADEEPASPEGSLARALIERAGDLVAGMLAGLIDVLAPDGKVGILAEGSTINKCPLYRERVVKILALLLDDDPGRPSRFSLLALENANLIGAAAGAFI